MEPGSETSIDLRRLRYFVAVAVELNFHRAAERLFMTQPALSRQIRRLEHDLGMTLFQRGSGPTALTSAGALLLAEGQVLLAAADATRSRMRRFAGLSETLTIGFFGGDTLTPSLRELATRRPDVDVRLRRIYWHNQEQVLRDGTVDVAFVHLPIDGAGLELVPVRHEQRMVMLPRHHHLASRRSLTLADVAMERVLVHAGASPEWEDAHNCDPRPDGTRSIPGPAVANTEEKLQHVAAGRAISFVPRSVAVAFTSEDVVYRPLDGVPPFDIRLARLHDQAAQPVAVFVEITRQLHPASA